MFLSFSRHNQWVQYTSSNHPIGLCEFNYRFFCFGVDSITSHIVHIDDGDSHNAHDYSHLKYAIICWRKFLFWFFSFCHSILFWFMECNNAHTLTDSLPIRIKHLKCLVFFNLIQFFSLFVFVFFAGAVAFLYCCSCEKRLIEYAVSWNDCRRHFLTFHWKRKSIKCNYKIVQLCTYLWFGGIDGSQWWMGWTPLKWEWHKKRCFICLWLRSLLQKKKIFYDSIFRHHNFGFICENSQFLMVHRWSDAQDAHCGCFSSGGMQLWSILACG